MGIILAYWKTGHIGVINRITRYAKAEFQFWFRRSTVDCPLSECRVLIDYKLKVVRPEFKTLTKHRLCCLYHAQDCQIKQLIQNWGLLTVRLIQFSVRFHKNYFYIILLFHFFTFLHFWVTCQMSRFAHGSFRWVNLFIFDRFPIFEIFI